MIFDAVDVGDRRNVICTVNGSKGGGCTGLSLKTCRWSPFFQKEMIVGLDDDNVGSFLYAGRDACRLGEGSYSDSDEKEFRRKVERQHFLVLWDGVEVYQRRWLVLWWICGWIDE